MSEMDDGSLFGNAFGRGVDQTQMMGYGFANAIGSFLGADSLEKWSQAGIESNLEELRRNPPRIESWDDIDSLSDFGTYFLEALGEGAPTLLAVLGSGGAGGAAALGAKAVGSKAASATLGKYMKRKLGKDAMAEFMKAKNRGQIAGAAAASYTLNTGETQVGFNQRGLDEPGAAFVTGGVKAALDMVGLKGIRDAARATNKPVSGWLDMLTNLGNTFGRGSSREALTEAMQTVVDMGATNLLDPSYEFSDYENLKEIGDAFLKGGIVGGSFAAGMTVPAQVYEISKVKKAQQDANARMDEEAFDTGQQGAETEVDDLAARYEAEPNENDNPEPTDFDYQAAQAEMESVTETPVTGDPFDAEGVAPIPEGKTDMEAQATALEDEGSTKKAMLVTPGSFDPYTMGNRPLPLGMEQIRFPTGDTVYTNDSETAEKVRTNEASDSLFGSILYNSEAGKPVDSNRVVQVTDPATGGVVTEIATNEEGLGKALEEAYFQAGEGRNVSVLSEQDGIPATLQALAGRIAKTGTQDLENSQTASVERISQLLGNLSQRKKGRELLQTRMAEALQENTTLAADEIIALSNAAPEVQAQFLAQFDDSAITEDILGDTPQNASELRDQQIAQVGPQPAGEGTFEPTISGVIASEENLEFNERGGNLLNKVDLSYGYDPTGSATPEGQASYENRVFNNLQLDYSKLQEWLGESNPVLSAPVREGSTGVLEFASPAIVTDTLTIPNRKTKFTNLTRGVPYTTPALLTHDTIKAAERQGQQRSRLTNSRNQAVSKRAEETLIYAIPPRGSKPVPLAVSDITNGGIDMIVGEQQTGDMTSGEMVGQGYLRMVGELKTRGWQIPEKATSPNQVIQHGNVIKNERVTRLKDTGTRLWGKQKQAEKDTRETRAIEAMETLEQLRIARTTGRLGAQIIPRKNRGSKKTKIAPLPTEPQLIRKYNRATQKLEEAKLASINSARTKDGQRPFTPDDNFSWAPALAAVKSRRPYDGTERATNTQDNRPEEINITSDALGNVTAAGDFANQSQEARLLTEVLPPAVEEKTTVPVGEYNQRSADTDKKNIEKLVNQLNAKAKVISIGDSRMEPGQARSALRGLQKRVAQFESEQEKILATKAVSDALTQYIAENRKVSTPGPTALTESRTGKGRGKVGQVQGIGKGVTQNEVDYVSYILNQAGLFTGPAGEVTETAITIMDLDSVSSVLGPTLIPYREAIQAHFRANPTKKATTFGTGKRRIIVTRPNVPVETDSTALAQERDANHKFVLAHEAGHILLDAAWDNLTPNQKAHLEKLWKKESEENPQPAWTGKQGFKEWFADKIAGRGQRHVNKRKPTNLAEHIYEKVIKQLKTLFNAVKGTVPKRFANNKAFDRFIDGLKPGVFDIDMAVALSKDGFSDININFGETQKRIQDVISKDTLRYAASKIRQGVKAFTNTRVGQLVMTRDALLTEVHEPTARAIYANTDDIYRHGEGIRYEKGVTYLNGGRSWRSGYERDRNSWLARAESIKKGASEAEMSQAYYELATETPTNELKTDVAKQFRALMEDLWETVIKVNMPYLADSKVENFWHRVFDKVNIANDVSGFEAVLKQYGVKNPTVVTNHILTPQNKVNDNGATTLVRGWERNRTLKDPELIKALVKAGFLNTDPVGDFTRYIEDVMSRTNFERVFGGYDPATGKYNSLLNLQTALRDIPKEKHAEFINLVNGSIWPNGLDPNNKWHNFLAEVKAFESLRVLLFSGVASTAELAGIYSSMKGVLSGREFRGILAETLQNPQQMKEFAEDMGVLAGAATGAMIQDLEKDARMGTGFGPRRILPAMFKYNGNDFVTRYTRVIAAQAGRLFVKRIAAQAVTGNASASTFRYLAELGITPQDVQLWVKLGEPAEAWALKGDERVAVEKVLFGIDTFINKAVLRPNASEKTVWAETALGGMVFHLKQFAYTYNKRILGGVAREANQRVQNGEEVNTLLPTLMGMLYVFMLFGALSDELRNRIKSIGTQGSLDGARGDRGQMIENWATRSGLFSLPFTDVITNPSAESAAYALGPTTHHLYELMFENYGDRTLALKMLKSTPGVSQLPILRREILQELD